MNGMHGAVEDYLTMRRALGFKLADPPAGCCTELALRWATRLGRHPDLVRGKAFRGARVRPLTCTPSIRLPRCHRPAC